MKLPSLPPKIATWSTAASFAASISYADRGTSAIAASSLLEQLHWTESQLGGVQSSFFIGYAITQVFGGVLGGQKSDDERGGYRAILPASLFFTGLTTLLFPLASIHFGHVGASIDRFVLGLFEGLLLPAAMAGVGDTVNTYSETSGDDENYKATASSLVIAGCYLGSGWAYLSAYVLFSEQFQRILIEGGFNGDIWSLVFYVNGILSFLLLWVFREEFDPFLSGTMRPFGSSNAEKSSGEDDVWKDTVSIAKQCFDSKSGRAILAAQIGQGALLYSIASWGPLYLERIGVESTTFSSTDTNMQSQIGKSSISHVAVAASNAAFSLIPSQITQALVGVSIGAAADQLSNRIGTQSTRRSLQLLSGVAPALILQYLALHGGDKQDNLLTSSFASPSFLFGAAQTISALSLGAVSVSHLDIAVPSAAGAVYALGNVMAAVAGSAMVNLFGFLLQQSDGKSRESFGDFSAGQEFALPFEVVAALSAVGSLVYGLTVETELEIGICSNSTLTA
jgi:MFS family permease